MHGTILRSLWAAPSGLVLMLLVGTPIVAAQAPGASPPRQQPPAPQQSQRLEQDRLARQVEELRRAGRFDEAVAVAERTLELERRTGEAMGGQVAEALARLAELHELRGDWNRAMGRRREALAVRERVDGKDHWRTADARLALTFAETVAGLGPADRAKVGGALRREQEAARLETQGKFGEAERVALEALETYRALVGPESAEVARAWHRIGRCRLARNDAGGAREANEHALTIRRKVLPGTHPDLGRSLNNLGLAESRLGNKRREREFLEEAVRLWRSSLESSNPLTAVGLNNLGALQLDLREYAAAKQSHEDALAIRRKSLPKDHPDIAQSLNNLGNVHYKLREYAAAKQSHEQALAIRRKALPPDHPDIADSLNNLGAVQYILREYAAAKLSHEQALAIRRKALPPDHPDIAQSLNNLGLVQYILREYAAAKQSHEQALAIRRKALPPDHPDIADSLNGLGLVQYILREYAAAKQSHEQALAIRRKALPPDHPDIACSLVNLGNVQNELREYALAKQSHEQALAIRRKAHPPDHPDIACSLVNLGNVQRELREYAATKQSHEQALAIRRKALPPDHPDIAQSLNNLGLVQYILREYAAAKQSHEQALAIRRKSLPPDHPDIASSLRSLGLLSLRSGVGVGDAVPGLAEATDLFQAEQLRLAGAQAEQEQLATAALARQSLQLLLAATLITRADPGTVYDRVVRVKGSVTAQQRWARQARDTADPDTTRLLDRLRLVTRQIIGLSMENRPAQSKSDPRDVPDEIRTLSAERDELERQLTERSAVYRTIQARAQVGSGEVRAALPEGSALIDLVDYFQMEPPAKGQTEPSEEPRMVAFVVRPKRQEVVIVPLGPSQALAKWIDRWRAYYGAGKAPPAGETDPGAELRKRLWEPLAAHLEGVKVVLVSPDGPLHGLPWAALPGSKQGTFLVHEYAFAVVPVPQLLPELLRGKPRLANQQPSLLLAGGIAFGEQNARDAETPAGKLPPVPVYGPLAGTESEVNDLEKRFRRTFPQAPPPLVLGEDQATKQAILAAAPAHRFLHLATHGFFAGESESSILLAEQRAALERGDLRLLAGVAGRHPGLLSGLVFAGVNRSDRRPEETILTALEAAELELGQVELVVLSACNTGRGQVAGGEGVLGLQRAFQLAGARSVVASLWRVPDEETHQLMREFYRRVWSDKPVPRVEALRQAQLWMLENWKPRGGLERPAPQGPPPPYVWAAFVLSGDWR